MPHIRAVYELRRFDAATDPDFNLALRLYARLIPGPLRTNSNEITYWVEHYTEFHPDEFCVFGFYCNNTIIGYAQCAYFSTQKIIAFDYLVLHEQHRSHGEYFQFLKLLKEWLYQQNWEIDYIAAEVAADLAPVNANNTAPVIELFKLAGFLVADCPYHQPQLGVNNEQSDLPAYLLVYCGETVFSLAVPAFLKIVHTIYFQHYERWYRPFIETPNVYRSHLDKRYAEIRTAAEKQSFIELNGIKQPIEPVSASAPAPARSKRNRQLVSSFCAAFLVLIFCFCLLVFQHVFGDSPATVLGYLVASLTASFAVFALFYKKGPAIFSQLLTSSKSSRIKRLR